MINSATIYKSTFTRIVIGGMLLLLFVSKASASDIHCLLPNNDPNCNFEQVTPVQDNSQQQTGQILNQFECKDDSDCVIVKERTCGLKSVFQGAPNNGTCICLKGPVIFGCVPKSQADMYRQ